MTNSQKQLHLTPTNTLEAFNASLLELKEEFHKTGRYDDANVKLDEILKLLSIKYFDLSNGTNHLSLQSLEKLAAKKFGDKEKIAKALQLLFKDISNNKIFINDDGTNIFGSNPNLNIQDVDNSFARKIALIIDSINPKTSAGFVGFDLLNESFGHFVRDNFRNHKEDAQYMTPDEVVNTIIDIAFQDILKDPISKDSLYSSRKDSFYVLDPTCGVGTFLTNTSIKITKLIESTNLKNKEEIIKSRKANTFIGKDKVDRMVRMSKLNALFYGLNPNNINQGNSIVGKSFIDKYLGKIDLIITNPPFGAEFPFSEMIEENGRFDILHKVKSAVNIQTINSELLMLDRSLKLLKAGGRLFIIVPDGVVSAGGLYETYRNQLSKHYNLKAVIDLPAVTFAQAGTRTKCSILYIQKPKIGEVPDQNGIYMSVADEIGYEVKERQGSPVKFYKGNNDLLQIASSYNKIENSKKPKVILEKPSIVIYPFANLINGKWNANFYRADRISAVESLKNSNPDEIEIKSIKEVAEFLNKQRRKINVGEKVKCISVLHINEESLVKIEDVKKYKPTCAGVECFENEIIFSKINPRIPRVAVVPKMGYELTCSSEFAILKPFHSRYTYLLKQLLLAPVVQKQILSLTSGTSSSHNRIKEAELMNVRIPWPKSGSQTEKDLLVIAKKIEDTEKKKYECSLDAITNSKKIDELVCV